MAHLKAIFFDIDDTLYSTYEFSEMARENSVRAMIKAGLRMPADSLRQELDEIVHEFSSNYEHHFDKLLLRVPRRFYKGINPAIIVAAAVTAYHDTKFRHLNAYDDVLEVLKLLAKLKRRLRRELDDESYRKVLKVIKEFEAWIEEELAESPRLL